VAVSNTLAVAQRCNLQLTLGKPRLPDFPTPGGVPIEQHFRAASRDGLEWRLAQLYPDEGVRDRERSRYVKRLEFELDTIVKMGFPGYFLIVADFIQWAKAHGCPVGPGRGSGAGSLVAYALSITDLDPLAYNLLFERFLNPERVSMPDFDIDFCQANRDRVIEYVKDKYGREAVSQIATFGTMAAKAALRDIGRVLGMGYGHVDSIAKLVVAPPGKTVTLAKVPEQPEEGILYARKEEPEIDRREAAEEEVAELLALATRVEGIVRNVGMHAGGVLIAPGKITDFCPLYQQPGSDAAVSQYDKDDVEAIGLVKFDFLGLATLTILELAKEMIRARRPQHANFDYAQLKLDDAPTYKLFAEGKTEAVFQFESRGMVGMLREAKPTRLEDLIAMNAMFRPGPMENIPMFCRRKNGQEPIEYPHPLLEQLLSETYGIFVYQEQVMEAARVLGGYSLGGADLLRRAMGKKKPEEMAQQREIFRQGAAAKGIDQAKADEVFDLMEKFAGYGFNKSHAAAYALLAYHTAWVKVHCTAEFYAANMTVELDDTDKLKVLLEDAKPFGVSFEPPDINRSVYRFEPVSDSVVRYGLGAIKGTGQGAIEAILQAREEAPFRSLFDFAARIDRQRVNKRVVEALIKAGAFDALHPDRAAAFASVSLAFDWADTQEVNEHQGGLFDFADSHAASTQEPALVKAQAWTIKERLTAEKSALGFYLSGHLFEEYAPEVRRFAKRRIADLVDSREPQLLAGIVGDLRVVNGARGRTAIFRLDDGSEYIEAVANEELFDANRERLREDELVIIQGRVQNDRFSGGLRLSCNAVWDLPAARSRFGRYLSVAVNGRVPPVADVIRTWPPRVQESEHGQMRQGLPIRILVSRERAEGMIDLGDDARFWPSDEALARWRTLAHEGRAVVVYE
jgi:DNA polymerase-3 subunit alpha